MDESFSRFRRRLLAWHRRHGRHDLPWQRPRTPYRVWISEIMLQQTQVATVRPYFQRFVERFPDVQSLAAADLDEVLHLWSGLGYYARARNLHQAARRIVTDHGGRFPERFDAVLALPGIGRSTAGAILSLALDQRHPVLDGNVKRVLARHFAVTGWPGRAAVARRLWFLAETLLPEKHVADHNQALMDLGATLCTRRAPRCDHCPLADDCRAHAQGTVERLPEPRPRRKRPVKAVQMLLVREPGGGVLLERRPPTGLWGGLWSLPELPLTEDSEGWCRLRGLDVVAQRRLEPRDHTFTHFELKIHPRVLEVKKPHHHSLDGQDALWYKPGRTVGGLAAPVQRLLQELLLEPRP